LSTRSSDPVMARAPTQQKTDNRRSKYFTRIIFPERWW